MVYKNYIKRIFISLLIFIIYITLNILNFEFIYFFILVLYLIIFFEIIINFKKFKFILLLYYFISFYFFLKIDFISENIYKFNFMVFIIISFDTFSYIFGKLLGSIKILKNISPKKTLEGLIGGIISSFIISFFYIFLTPINFNIFQIFFILIVIFSSFLGDIIESYFKRINYLKNSSELLPGHGGFFDRFDSFILSIIFYYFLSSSYL